MRRGGVPAVIAGSILVPIARETPIGITRGILKKYIFRWNS